MSLWEIGIGAAAALVGALIGGVLTYRIWGKDNQRGKGWREFFIQLLPAVVFGLGVIWVASKFVDTDAERTRLMIDAVKDCGVVIVGIAIVEVVWAALGGSPVDRDLRQLADTLSATTTDLTGKFAGATTKFEADVAAMTGQFNADVKGISKLVAGSANTGLVDVGESQDTLGWLPANFESDVIRASVGIDLCGATLGYVRQNDRIINALVKKADDGIPVRIILPAPDGDFLVALFEDKYKEEIVKSASALAAEIKARSSKIQIKFLKAKALTMTMLRVDENILVVPYIYSEQTFHSPRFKIKGSGTSLFKKYTGEFDKLFQIAVS